MSVTSSDEAVEVFSISIRIHFPVDPPHPHEVEPPSLTTMSFSHELFVISSLILHVAV